MGVPSPMGVEVMVEMDVLVLVGMVVQVAVQMAVIEAAMAAAMDAWRDDESCARDSSRQRGVVRVTVVKVARVLCTV